MYARCNLHGVDLPVQKISAQNQAADMRAIFPVMIANQPLIIDGGNISMRFHHFRRSPSNKPRLLPA